MGTVKMGKDDEKSIRPMFPRVHVSDTEKGGPRAPPRNKMALYEQLSIPLQKFSKPGSVVPSASSIQGGSNERNARSPFYLSSSMPTSSAEKPYSQSSDGKSNKTRGVEFEKSTGRVEYITSLAAGSGAESSAFNVHDFKSGTNSLKAKFEDDNDDFRVPTLAQSEVASHSKDAPLVEVNKLASFGATNAQNSANLDSSVHVLSSSSEPIHEANASGKLSRKRERMHVEQECTGTISSKDHGDKFPNYPESGEVLAGPSKNSLVPADRGSEINTISLDKTGHQRARICNEASYDGSVENRNACKMQRQSCSRASFEYSQINYEDKANGLGELKNAERSGEVSEVSMIDSISVLDISPDDVVGVIGPKQFWKARRAIVNQQRVFAIQVFELHRLIKVQKLFAASPHLLMDDSDIITIQPKVTTKSLPIASSLKYQQDVQKPSQNADPLVEKTAAPSPQPQEKDPNKELCQLPKNVPLTANTHQIPTAPENRPNPWCFQPSPNQWLIPVMSPSEGLIYKPYAGPCPPPPGFMAPLYGGCGPLNLPSVAGDFMNSAYGFPSSHQQQSRVLPVSPAIGPNYFPAPYGLPMVNPAISASAVEQVSPLTNVRSDGRSMQCSQSSCNISITKSEALSGYLPKIKSSSKDNELQASTASSPCDKAQGEGRDLLPVIPIPPATEGSCQPSQSSGKENQTHVIKVIPHNARSATESAARIFRSIQRERRQLDL
ncbi:ELF3-like protein 2 [Dendrobium catenatum]|uniref:Protein EARLY FLOWERING 3 n=1 Tax=Dendrobium catenatum TaxID=906689 RepID=A0A2I0VGM8_9ASPA|nr:ELF3-like protein 2 [Dendrobium catenatum]PKU62571.1 Protein EARLY FLOWERING 3 [Dendrobium catenatum]